MADPVDVRVGRRIRERRERRGLTQKELAEKLAGLGWKIDPTALTRIEKGERSVRVSQLDLLARALDSTVFQFLQGDAVLDVGVELSSAHISAIERLRRLMYKQDEFRATMAMNAEGGWRPDDSVKAAVSQWLDMSPETALAEALALGPERTTFSEGAEREMKNPKTYEPFDLDAWMAEREAADGVDQEAP